MKNIVKIILAITFVAIAIFFIKNNANQEKKDSSESGTTHIERTTDEKVLRIALSVDPDFHQLDNTLSQTQLIQANAMVYEGLVKYGKKGTLEPALAKSWTISEDGKKYTFNIREGVLFNDGTPLTAEVVKFSFERWVYDPKQASMNIAKYLDSIDVVDDMTIVFNFTESYYPILTEFSYPRPVGIMGINSVSPAGNPKGKFVKAIGTGAWMIDSYKKDQQSILTVNPHYWGEAPLMEKVLFQVIPDPQARIYAMQTGEIDITGGVMSSVSVDSLSSIADDKNIEIKKYPSTTSYFTIFNYRNPLLKDVAVRKAMNMLLDKDAIVEHIMNGLGKPTKALFQEDVPYTTAENSEWYSFDVESAKKLLADAGYTLNADGIQEKDGKALSFKFVFSDKEYPEWKVMSEYIQSQFLKAGIEITLDNREVNAYYDSLWKDKDYDLILYRTYSDAWNPHGFLLGMFTGTEDAPAVAWQDSELSSMINNVIMQNKEEAKQQGYDAIYKKMYNDAMHMPVYYPNEIFLVNKELKDIQPGFDANIPFIWHKINIK